jgi:hypothetical protein
VQEKKAAIAAQFQSDLSKGLHVEVHPEHLPALQVANRKAPPLPPAIQ